MTDERAALIESLARGEPCAADACLSRLPDNCQCAHAAFMLASDAAKIARLSEEARYERARADKAVAQLEATKADFRDFADTRELIVRDYCALVDALGVDMDAPPAVLDAVRRHGLSLSALNAARKEARALREALAKAHEAAEISECRIAEVYDYIVKARDAVNGSAHLASGVVPRGSLSVLQDIFEWLQKAKYGLGGRTNVAGSIAELTRAAAIRAGGEK